jgi:D-xylose transport system permease protein
VPVSGGLPLTGRTQALAAALLAIGIGFDLATDGLFLTARNLQNLAVQSSVVGILACGMVLVIVARHIDLSVGSVLGLVAIGVATLQVEGLAGSAAWHWPLALAAGLALGATIGAAQGGLVAWLGLPAFVVTLAGLLIFRGAAYLVTDGRTVAPLSPGFRSLGGGAEGSIGMLSSWALGAAAIAVLGTLALRRRRARTRHGFEARSIGREALPFAAGAACIVAGVLVMSAPVGDASPRGIPVPVLVLVGAALATAGLARHTRFGRHVFAIGGGGEAAALAGIAVRRVTVGVFAWMGLLAAVAGSLTAARLDAGTNSMGTLAELGAIAAAVLGGSSLAGGVGAVGGAVLGAFVMQALENGLVLLGVSSALRQVATGGLLLVAVAIDATLQRRRRR